MKHLTKVHHFQVSHLKLQGVFMGNYRKTTPPKFNIAPEKWWVEDYFPIGKVTFQGLC